MGIPSSVYSAEWRGFSAAQKIAAFTAAGTTVDELRDAGVDDGTIQWMIDFGGWKPPKQIQQEPVYVQPEPVYQEPAYIDPDVAQQLAERQRAAQEEAEARQARRNQIASLQNLSATEKARFYLNELKRGVSDTALRQEVESVLGYQSAWSDLQQLAKELQEQDNAAAAAEAARQEAARIAAERQAVKDKAASVGVNLPSNWFDMGAQDRVNWLVSNKVTEAQLRAYGTSQADIDAIKTYGYYDVRATTAAPTTTPPKTTQAPTIAVTVPPVTTAQPAYTQEQIANAWHYNAEERVYENYLTGEISKTRPSSITKAPLVTEAPTTTSPPTTTKSPITIPDDWYSYDAAQKIAWFNAHEVTIDYLKNAGVDSATINWMLSNGYSPPQATTLPPTTAAPTTTAPATTSIFWENKNLDPSTVDFLKGQIQSSKSLYGMNWGTQAQSDSWHTDDLAKRLTAIGITDLSQIGVNKRFLQLGPDGGVYDYDLFDKRTGKAFPDLKSIGGKGWNIIGSTGEGKGYVEYRVDIDAFGNAIVFPDWQESNFIKKNPELVAALATVASAFVPGIAQAITPYVSTVVGSTAAPAVANFATRTIINTIFTGGDFGKAVLGAVKGEALTAATDFVANQLVSNKLVESLEKARSIAAPIVNSVYTVANGGDPMPALVGGAVNAVVNNQINNFATENKLDPTSKSLLQIGVGQAINTFRTGQFNPASMINTLVTLGFSQANASTIAKQEAKDKVATLSQDQVNSLLNTTSVIENMLAAGFNPDEIFHGNPNWTVEQYLTDIKAADANVPFDLGEEVQLAGPTVAGKGLINNNFMAVNKTEFDRLLRAYSAMTPEERTKIAGMPADTTQLKVLQDIHKQYNNIDTQIADLVQSAQSGNLASKALLKSYSALDTRLEQKAQWYQLTQGLQPGTALDEARRDLQTGQLYNKANLSEVKDSNFPFEVKQFINQFRGTPQGDALANTLAGAYAVGGSAIANTLNGALGINLHLAEALGMDTFAKDFRELAGTIKSSGDNALAIADAKTDAGKNFIGGLSNVVSSIPWLATGVVPGIVAGAMAQTYGNEYIQGRFSGLSPDEAGLRATLMAIAEGVGERIGASEVTALLKPLWRETPTSQLADVVSRSLMQKIGEVGTKEQLGELLTFNLQFATDKLSDVGLNQQATGMDYLRGALSTMQQTFVAAGGNTGVAVGLKGGFTPDNSGQIVELSGDGKEAFVVLGNGGIARVDVPANAGIKLGDQINIGATTSDIIYTPQQNIDRFAQYANQVQDLYGSELGRDPSFDELQAAIQSIINGTQIQSIQATLNESPEGKFYNDKQAFNAKTDAQIANDMLGLIGSGKSYADINTLMSTMGLDPNRRINVLDTITPRQAVRGTVDSITNGLAIVRTEDGRLFTMPATDVDNKTLSRGDVVTLGLSTIKPDSAPTVRVEIAATPAVTVTQSQTPTVTQTVTQTPTVTQTATPTITATATQTVTPTVTQTVTETAKVTETITQTVTQALTPTITQTFTPSVTPTVTQTEAISVTETVTQNVTPTVTQTVTPTITATVTQTVTPTVTQTVTPTVTQTVTQTLTPTVTQTVTPTVTQTVTQTVTPTVTQTVTPTVTQTVTPTVTQTSTVTQTVTPTITITPSITEIITTTQLPPVTTTITVPPVTTTITPSVVTTTQAPSTTAFITTTQPVTTEVTTTQAVTTTPVVTTTITTTKPVTTKPVTTVGVTTPAPFPLFGIPAITGSKTYVDYAQPQVAPPEFGPFDLFKAPNYLRPLQDTGNFGLAALIGAVTNDAKQGDGGNQSQQNAQGQGQTPAG